MYENKNWIMFGYNAHHMGHYLTHLKDSKIIQSYIWKRRVKDWDFECFFVQVAVKKISIPIFFYSEIQYRHVNVIMQPLLLTKNEGKDVDFVK